MKRRLTLQFPREAVHQPITYRLAVDYDVASRIIRAQVAPNQRGTLVVELSGDIDELDAAQEWLMSLGLSISSAAGEIAIDPKRCVDCGICSSVWSQKPLYTVTFPPNATCTLHSWSLLKTPCLA